MHIQMPALCTLEFLCTLNIHRICMCRSVNSREYRVCLKNKCNWIEKNNNWHIIIRLKSEPNLLFHFFVALQLIRVYTVFLWCCFYGAFWLRSSRLRVVSCFGLAWRWPFRWWRFRPFPCLRWVISKSGAALTCRAICGMRWWWFGWPWMVMTVFWTPCSVHKDEQLGWSAVDGVVFKRARLPVIGDGLKGIG